MDYTFQYSLLETHMQKNLFAGVISAAVCASLLVVSLPGISSAQPMRMSPENQAKMLKDSLALDSVQTAKAVVILKEASDARMKAMQSAGDDRDARRATMTDIVKKADDKIKAILTDTQKKKYEEMIKNRPARGMGRRGNN